MLRSPAKINLHLRVAPPEPTEFHPLRSWMILTDLYDEIRFATANDGPPLALSCDDPTLACDGSNLVWRAAAAVTKDLPSHPPITIHLTKRIPAGAGLGGGSGNAATTLIGVTRLLGLRHTPAALHALAATLGSDVPFFLGASSAIATGRGEHLQPTPPPAIASTALLGLPPFGVSTAEAYRTLDRMRPTADAGVLDPFDAADWSTRPAADLLPRLINDLEPAAFAIQPRLGELREAISRQLGRIVRMSGSGSTLFTLYDDFAAAEAASAAVAARFGMPAVAVRLGKATAEFSE